MLAPAPPFAPGDQVLSRGTPGTHTVAATYTYPDPEVGLVLVTTDDQHLLADMSTNVTTHQRRLHEGARVVHTHPRAGHLTGTVTQGAYPYGDFVAVDVAWDNGTSGTFVADYIAPEEEL